ncbi:hypothetical protein Pla108_13730 [Botrimarina colliarenosi]|uniref:Uncharacterized protein n=1 Tax=Botrimarina colliarenosi TaxID=2528001 RepID=A0A5C6AN33_9BACT|nr:hypothetical protein [Botrimarina colliarenosi]TWU00422.1 hypothetical protein Pla108_13730 [Botrimarina colliarenosi]
MPQEAQHAFSFGSQVDDADDTALDDGSYAWTPGEAPPLLRLELDLRDPAVIDALWALPEGRARDEFAADALRIGVAALRHASSRIDTEQVKSAGEQLLSQLKDALNAHADHAQKQTATVLKEYFDPKSGRLSERVERLVGNDGELATLLRSQLHGDGSPLARLLSTQLGRESPLMRQLDPEQSSGLLCRLQKTVDEQLRAQREHVLREFSLDVPDSALRRLVDELAGKHGDLQKGLGDKIDNVVKEFSLDKEDSALSRLVRNVDRAQRTISSEFSLDNDDSGLSRLKRELLTILSAHVDSNAKFQEEVSVTLAKLVQKRESAAVSPEHGHEFEGAVLAYLANQAEQRGDLCEATGATTGLVKNCKVGDAVLRLGPETPAPGARIVFEAKEARGYSTASAIDELETARKNRGADFGVFVWSRQTAPEAAKPLARYGQDLLVVWDAEDPSTDPYLLAAIEIARACVVEQHRGDAVEDIDVEAIDRSINAIEKTAQGLEKIGKPAESIKRASETILDRVRIEQNELERQVATLRQKLAGLRGAEA